MRQLVALMLLVLTCSGCTSSAQSDGSFQRAQIDDAYISPASGVGPLNRQSDPDLFFTEDIVPVEEGFYEYYHY